MFSIKNILLTVFSLTTLAFGDTSNNDVKLAHTQDCRLLADGIYSDPSDCHRYFHCSGSKTFYFRCYDGFVFDPCDLRCKMRDVCIQAEFCSKNLQNLTLNMYRQSSTPLPADPTKVVNEVIKLNELQNDAELRDPMYSNGQRLDTRNNARSHTSEFIPSGTPYYPTRVVDDRRVNEVQEPRDSSASTSTTQEVRLAVVRNFNEIEASSNAVIQNRTEKHDRSTKIDSTLTSKQWFVASSTLSESADRLHGYPTTVSNTNTSIIDRADFSNSYQEGTSTLATNEPREFAADTKENRKGQSELEEEKVSSRNVAGQQTTTIATPASTSVSTQHPTTTGTTEATMTYIVKVVFSRRGKPDSQKGTELESDDGPSRYVETTTITRTTEEEESNFASGDHVNSARIKIDPVVKKPNEKNFTSFTNLPPVNNSVAEVGLQNQGDPSTIRSNSTNLPEPFEQFKNTTIGPKHTKTEPSANTDKRTTTESFSLVDTSDLADINSTSTAHTSTGAWSTKTQQTTTQLSNNIFTNATIDNYTETTHFNKVANNSVTVTISPAARLVDSNVTAEEKSVMSNITLSCNPTISSALCEKSDNQTREALARHCQQLACNNGGMYISLSNGHCGCACPNGFKGETCLDMVDKSLCHCINGGRCVDIGNDTFTCRCPLGYLGNKCQYPIDELQPKISNLMDSPPPGPKLTTNKGNVDLNKYLLCMVNHCSNGGICLKEIETGNSQCFCSHNFAGQFCEKKCINC